MKIQIKEFAEISGVSIRTLRYYDEIGLLKPAFVDENTGYRYYDENSAARMQEILFYRELDFPLKNIFDILSSPKYDKQNALTEQKKLLILKKERLERLIAAVEKALKGEIVMNEFNNNDFEKYKSEVKERWGNTKAYAEYQDKSKTAGNERQNAAFIELEAIFAEFAARMCSGNTPESDEVQNLIKKLKDHITANFYNCTDDILSGLGKMYIADERFKNNIDKHFVGTAEFVSKAIEIYCG